MAPAEVISIAGITDKIVSWTCPQDRIEASAVHPVQMAHLHIGQEEEDAARRRTRLVHMEMAGAELIVFHELLAPTGQEQSHA